MDSDEEGSITRKELNSLFQGFMGTMVTAINDILSQHKDEMMQALRVPHGVGADLHGGDLSSFTRSSSGSTLIDVNQSPVVEKKIQGEIEQIPSRKKHSDSKLYDANWRVISQKNNKMEDCFKTSTEFDILLNSYLSEWIPIR